MKSTAALWSGFGACDIIVIGVTVIRIKCQLQRTPDEDPVGSKRCIRNNEFQDLAIRGSLYK